MTQPSPVLRTPSPSELRQILDLARWAPSGDNSQPWRFACAEDGSVKVVILFQTPSVFDREYFATAMSAGALLETLKIAARLFGFVARVGEGQFQDAETLVFSIAFEADAESGRENLASAIKTRSVCRSPYQTRALTADEKAALVTSVGDEYDILWLDGAKKWDAVKVLCAAEKIRTFTPEVFREYQRVIDWKTKTSIDKMPGASMGLDDFTVRFAVLMFKSWNFYKLCNYVLGGYLLSLVKLDLLPGLGCAGHFVLLAKSKPQTILDHVIAGEAMQRLWLTATSLGLVHQPSITPLAFARYGADTKDFSVHPKAMHWARAVRRRMSALLGGDSVLDRAVWFGRIGEARPSHHQNECRSLRRPLDDLLIDEAEVGTSPLRVVG